MCISKFKLVLAGALFISGVANSAYADWYFRGTPNSWGTTALTATSSTTYETCQLFGASDSGGPRFKIDKLGTWSESYPASDYLVSASTAYKITFNSSTKAITTQAVTNCTNGVAVTNLGATYSAAATVFSLWSPDSSNVQVKVKGILYPMVKAMDFNGYTGVYQARVPGDMYLGEYNFVVNGVDVRDPYAKMAKPQTNSNIVMDMSRTAVSGGWAARPAMVAREDAIIYETHVRDFTIDASSGVSAANRGKFLGMVQTGTTYSGVKTGIDHLKELGVTHVQLLPVFDFNSCEGLPSSDNCYNWGYDPRNYNVPDERYSLTPNDYENRAREFKTMVNEYHKAGIRVVMDVVYNHTYSKDVFNPISGKYYTAADLSGCGNSLDASQPMVSRMIQDSLQYWAEEYNIDGFRFDLMGVFPYAEVEKWGSAMSSKFSGRNVLMYGEPWTGATDANEASHVRYGTTRNLVEEHVGVFNGAYRDAIKGDNDGVSKGYMFNNPAAADNGWAIYDGMRASPYNSADTRNSTWFRNFTADPEQTLNYISVHDNFGLWDKIYLTTSTNVVLNNAQVLSLTPPTDLGYAKRVVNFGSGIVLTSQGFPLIQSGDEFLRSKTNNQQLSTASAWNYNSDGGAHNAYNAPDSYNSIKWANKVNNAATFKYFKDLISLRRNHVGLRMNTNAEIAQYLALGVPAEFNGEVVTGTITNPRDTTDLFVVYNSGANRYVNLPLGTWTQVANAAGVTNVTGLSATALVEGTAVTVFTKPH
jgi:pullulanase